MSLEDKFEAKVPRRGRIVSSVGVLSKAKLIGGCSGWDAARL